MSGKSPTARSLALLRAMGYDAQVVEYYHGPSKKRRDLFGCIDIVGAHSDLGILGVQATTGAHHAERFKKAVACSVTKWLEAGAHLQIWSWTKKADKKWHCRVQQVGLKDLIE